MLSAALLVAVTVAAPAPEAGPPAAVSTPPTPRRYLPVAQFRYAWFGPLALPADGGGDALHTRSQLLLWRVQAGHFFGRTGTVVAGAIGYDLLLLDTAPPGPGAGLGPLHHLSVRLALGQRVHKKWLLTAFGRPGVASDLHGFRSRDLRLSTGVAARFAHRPHLVFVFGALYNNGVFGHLVLPILHVLYRWRWLRLRLQFPHRAALWFVPHRRVELGLVGRFASGLFGVHHALRQQALGDRYSTLFVTAGLAARVYLYRGWFMTVDGGYLVRYLRVYDGGAQTHGRLEWRGGYVSAATGYLL